MTGLSCHLCLLQLWVTHVLSSCVRGVRVHHTIQGKLLRAQPAVRCACCLCRDVRSSRVLGAGIPQMSDCRSAQTLTSATAPNRKMSMLFLYAVKELVLAIDAVPRIGCQDGRVRIATTDLLSVRSNVQSITSHGLARSCPRSNPYEVIPRGLQIDVTRRLHSCLHASG
jgi:hypothetical protein